MPNNLRKLRKEKSAREGKEIKQKEAAQHLKVTNHHLSKLEMNKKNPSIELAKRAAAYYEVTLDEIFLP